MCWWNQARPPSRYHTDLDHEIWAPQRPYILLLLNNFSIAWTFEYGTDCGFILSTTLTRLMWTRLAGELSSNFGTAQNCQLMTTNFRSAVHWARQYQLDGTLSWSPARAQVLINKLAAMKLPSDDSEPLSLVHRFLRGQTPLSLGESIQTEPQLINAMDELGFTPLHWASRRRDFESARILIKAGADVNKKTRHEGETPLLIAHHYDWTPPLKIGRLLLESGASPDLSSPDGYTPLHHAVMNDIGNDKVLSWISLLLSHGADPKASTRGGNGVLHLLRHGSIAAIKKLATLLLEWGVNLEARGLNGRTPLFDAFYFGRMSVAQALIELGANPMALDADGDNGLGALVHAWLAPSEQHIIWGLSTVFQGLNPDTKNRFGRSVLNTMATRVDDPDNDDPIPIWQVVDFIALFLAVREANWKAGQFLHTRDIFIQNGSHARLTRWVSRQRHRMEGDSSYVKRHCVNDDIAGWYETEDDTSSSDNSETDDNTIDGSEDEEEDVFHDASEASDQGAQVHS